MQTLKVITGMRQEGKTTELMESYFKQYAVEAIDKYFNLVFINNVPRVPFDIFEEYMKTMIPDTLSEEQVATIKSGTHNIYFNVKDSNEIKSIINKEINKKDCIFFIDGCDSFFNAQDAINIMNEYPNTECLNSFDIDMTMNVKKTTPISEFIESNDWFKRLIDERDNLHKKIESLRTYNCTKNYAELSQHQRNLLDVQLNGMIVYFDTLVMRINLVISENNIKI